MRWLRNSIIILCVALLACGLPPASVSGEGTAGQAGAFLKMGIDARALAMGGAYVAVADDAAAVYWNPAGLAMLQRHHLSASYTWFPEGGDYSQVAFAIPISAFAFPQDAQAGSNGDATGGAIGLSLLRYAASHSLEARRTDSLNPDYMFSDIEGCYQLAYGMTLAGAYHVGLGVKGLYHLLDQESANGWGTDAGMSWTGVPGLTVALAVRDVYSQIYWTTHTRETFPAVIKAGAAYTMPLTDLHRVLASLEAENNLSDMPTKFQAGLEYGFNQLLFARGGYHDGVWTFGGGLRIRSIGWGRAGIQLDYAALENRIAGWDHWMTFQVLF